MSLTSTSATAARLRPSVAVSPSSGKGACGAHGPGAVTDRKAYSLPELWHLLSLDAPTVAALWTLFLAQRTGVSVPWTCGVGLFLAVWLLYVADRLLDARPTPEGEERSGLEERHRFHWRHRSAFSRVLGAGAALLLLLLTLLPSRALHLYLLLSLPLAVWFLLIHTRRARGSNPQPLPKELMVGVFFGLAVAIPTLAHNPEFLLRLVPFVALFAALCTLNCLFLSAWEQDELELAGQRLVRAPTPAHVTTRWAARHLYKLGVLVLLVCVFTCFSAMGWPQVHPAPLRLTSFAFACALSAGSLLLLHAFRDRVDRLTLRVAGDAVLLTPLLFLHALG